MISSSEGRQDRSKDETGGEEGAPSRKRQGTGFDGNGGTPFYVGAMKNRKK
jgi:hypothetical protein